MIEFQMTFDYEDERGAVHSDGEAVATAVGLNLSLRGGEQTHFFTAAANQSGYAECVLVSAPCDGEIEVMHRRRAIPPGPEGTGARERFFSRNVNEAINKIGRGLAQGSRDNVRDIVEQYLLRLELA